MRLLAAAFALSLMAGTASAQAPAAVVTDPPRDAAHPAGMAYVQIPSRGVLLNGVMYTASGAGPHPTLVLFHGFPGNEQNLDLAQAVRRAGFNVLTLHYRGSWGSPGAFSFTHCAEDADAALAFARDPKTVARFGIDTDRLFTGGHSMGGFMAASSAAHDLGVKGVVMISAWNIGGTPAAAANDPGFRENVVPLAGTSVEALIAEIQASPEKLKFTSMTDALKTRPVLLITADDGSPKAAHELAEALKAAGDRDVGEIHMTTDHPFSDHRIALESAVVEWLAARGGS
jgi:pimeloyl-ACP methyl ester carboxylesterase